MPLGGTRWNTFPETGTMTAREFFTGCEPLLQGVIDASPELDRGVLDDQIKATLGLETREASLPLRAASAANRELAAQAAAIGALIAGWTGQALDRLLTDPIPLPAGRLAIRSNCDGHLLTAPAADMLLGRRGGPVPMQLFNEWLHQMVLLRDALLPFTNPDEVPLWVTPTGLRHIEEARERFLAEALFRQIRHSSIVAFARQAVTGAAVPGTRAYGFDHDGGTVLPAVVGASPLTAPAHLLTWRSAAPGSPVTAYVSETADYYAAPRTLIEQLPAEAPELGEARVVAGPIGEGVRTAHIAMGPASVDLGQALRGHRYAYHAPPAPTGGAAGAAPRSVEPAAVLAAGGLVWTSEGDVAVNADALDDLALLALLGKLYPENVILRAGRSVSASGGGAGGSGEGGSADAGGVGKDGLSRVVVDVAG
ncbi:hypothetical protein ACFY36_10325 [Actinoplanes sp. NPDC000266]